MRSRLDLGWDAAWEQAFETWLARAGATTAHRHVEPARVVAQVADTWRVQGDFGERVARPRGALRAPGAPGSRRDPRERKALPVVGDWVAVEARPHDATILGVLPRRSKLSRHAAGRATTEQVLAANVDVVVLMQSLNQELNLHRLERFLAAVWQSGARPLVVLNKADLCTDAQAQHARVQAAAPGVDVLIVSALAGAGLDDLQPHLLPGRTLVLLGTSGVGKSTLLNRLLGEERQRVRDIRPGDDRGRHTTSARQLFRIPGGALVIDTPGLRELQLWDGREGVERAFDDISGLAVECRYRDCRHESEPGCAVRRAVDEGRLDADRLASHHKLQRELRHLERNRDVRLQNEEKRRWRSIHREMRHRHRHRQG